MKYLHFTDLKGARGIKASGTILGSSYGAAGVYAVAEGSLYTPGVIPGSGKGRARNRNVAVVFTTRQNPDVKYTEEVMWREDELPVRVLDVLPAEKAVDQYLIKSFDDKDLASDLEFALDLYDAKSSWWNKLEAESGIESGNAFVQSVRIRGGNILFTLRMIGARSKPKPSTLEGLYDALDLKSLPVSAFEFLEWNEGRWKPTFEDDADYTMTLDAEMKVMLEENVVMSKLSKKVARAYMRRLAGKPGPNPEEGDGLNTWFGDDTEMGDWVAIAPKNKTYEDEDGNKKTIEKGDIIGPCGEPEGDWSDETDGGKDPLKCMPREKAKDMPKSERAEKAEDKMKAEKKDKNTGKEPTRTPTLKDKEDDDE